MFDLNSIWFMLIGILLIGYAILDGFDLGIGILHLFTKTDNERRIMINSIGPVWDGNEVWLIVAGGALFAAFPKVYATIFSGFYMAFMLILLALIFRAVAIEFRSKQPMPWWRKMWDVSFSMGSILASFLFGVAVGNIIWGVPLNEFSEFDGTFFDLLHPYTLLIGILTVTLFAMHGAIYGTLKTEGDINTRLQKWAQKTTIIFIILYVVTTLVTGLFVPHMRDPFFINPFLLIIFLINIVAIVNVLRAIHRGKTVRAFLSSCIIIATLLILFGIGMFPNMVISNPVLQNSLTIHNGASSPQALRILLIIAGLGMPFVVAYTIIIYWVFRGKVKIDSLSY